MQTLPPTRHPRRNPKHLVFEWKVNTGFGLHQGGYLTKLSAAVVVLYPALSAAIAMP